MLRTSIVAVALTALLAAQQDQQAKLHPYLQQQLQKAGATDLLPVYFVIGDRLDYDHWFPRVWQMPLKERRATVVRELREHAARTQRGLLDYLGAEQRAGNASDIHSNWLGNFVQAKATPLAVLTAATLPEVAEVWFDYEPLESEVQDGVVGAAPADAAPEPVPARAPVDLIGPPPPRTAGNGPIAVLADRVWAFGIEGQGVVVANVDGGIDTSPSFHTDLVANIWVNPGEIPGNNIDDDNNGYIDDVNGWNFVNNNNALNDSGGHGSSTAGCIAADGTCTGVTYGIAPACRLITCKISSESSTWNGIQYALTVGADNQTSSYSYKLYSNPPPNYKMHRDLGVNTLAAGLIRTNSTSNDGSYCSSTTNAARRPFNISAPGNLPPPYLDPNQTLRGQLGGVIGVAAWNFTSNTLMSYSPCGPFAWNLADLLVNRSTYPGANWDNVNHNDYPWTGGSQQGLLKPDVSSPTGTLTTTSAPCTFATFSGTSNATPVAQGVAVLWKSANPSLTPEDFGMIVHQTSRDRGSVPGKENNWGAGVIDAEAGLYRALCIHRVDGQPAWRVDHSIASGPVTLALDGVPGSFGAMAVGVTRQDVTLGPVTVGIGGFFSTVWVGFTDGSGDAALPIQLSGSLVGLSFFTQAFLWDQSITNRILTSNVIEVGLSL